MNIKKAIQDYYPDDVSHCYGCGKLNPLGHQLKTYQQGDETISTFLPPEHFMAIPGFVYGGLIASLIDCHGTGSAALASCIAAGKDPEKYPPPRFVTASLSVNYLKPTPMGTNLELRGKVLEIKGNKVITEITVSANNIITAIGKVVAVQMPQSLIDIVTGRQNDQ